MKQREHLTSSELKKKAFLMAWRLKHSGLDPEAIYPRLEKQGIQAQPAVRVVTDLMVQTKKTVDRKKSTMDYEAALLRVLLAAVFALASYVVLPEHPFLPILTTAGGLIAAMLAKKENGRII